MNQAQYRNARVGDRVTTRRELRNGYVQVPAGTKATITGKRSGFALRFEPCRHCGVAAFITKVNPSDVEPAT